HKRRSPPATENRHWLKSHPHWPDKPGNRDQTPPAGLRSPLPGGYWPTPGLKPRPTGQTPTPDTRFLSSLTALSSLPFPLPCLDRFYGHLWINHVPNTTP